jgi:hypothetical protein
VQNGILLILAAVCVTLTSVLILSTKVWRFALGFLAVQFVGVFVITAQIWPFEMAIVKLVAGWMSVAIIWLAAGEYIHISSGNTPASVTTIESKKSFPTNKAIERPFLLLTATLVGLVITSQIQEISTWTSGVPVEMLWSALILVGVGFLILGFTDQIMTTILGLLTALSGFELFYAPMQNSLLVTGMLACLNLGIAFAGAYLLLSSHMEAE